MNQGLAIDRQPHPQLCHPVRAFHNSVITERIPHPALCANFRLRLNLRIRLPKATPLSPQLSGQPGHQRISPIHGIPAGHPPVAPVIEAISTEIR